MSPKHMKMFGMKILIISESWTIYTA